MPPTRKPLPEFVHRDSGPAIEQKFDFVPGVRMLRTNEMLRGFYVVTQGTVLAGFDAEQEDRPKESFLRASEAEKRFQVLGARAYFNCEPVRFNHYALTLVHTTYIDSKWMIAKYDHDQVHPIIRALVCASDLSSAIQKEIAKHLGMSVPQLTHDQIDKLFTAFDTTAFGKSYRNMAREIVSRLLRRRIDRSDDPSMVEMPGHRFD